MLLCSPAGNDILFDESQIEQGRNFCNKLWNAYRLVSSWKVEDGMEPRNNEKQAAAWFSGRVNHVISEVESSFADYRLNEALMSIYKLIWDDFCSTFLEAIKPPFGEAASAQTVQNARAQYDVLLQMLHPFMPFITEELHSALAEGKPDKPCIVSSYPVISTTQQSAHMEPILVVTEIRNVRNARNIPPREKLNVNIRSEETVFVEFREFIEKLSNAEISINGEVTPGAIVVLAGTAEVSIAITEELDPLEEKRRIGEELEYLKGFLQSVNVKLNNERFVAGAKPEIVEKERQKKADAEQKIENLVKQLERL